MRMHAFSPFIIAAFAVLASAPARADVVIRVDKSAQVMTVTVDGAQRYAWPVSTGVADYDTPSGEFQPFRMEKDHFSREWDDAPMPYSVFFTQKGHAIHGTYHKSLGHPASHGCVRLSVANAATLFALVKKEGMKNTKVTLTGEIPGGGAAIARHQPAQPRYQARYRDQQAYDDDDTGALPPRTARVYRETPRYYDYSGDRNYYAAPRRSYGGNFPFGW